MVTKPPIPVAPHPPEIVDLLPPSTVITADEVSYYLEACNAWKSVGTEGGPLTDEVAEDYPGLTQGDACEWAVFGYTVQGSITWDEIINQMANYAELMRNDRITLIQIIENMYDVSLETSQAIKELNTPKQGLWGKLFGK